MTKPFDDSYPPDDRDPIDGQSGDFAWNEVFERSDSGDGLDTTSDQQVETIGRLMHLLLADAQAGRINPKTVGLRVIAVAWVLNPSHYPDAPSLRKLAERCGVSPAALAFYTGEVSRQTGIRNRAQRHAANWKPTSPPHASGS